MSAPADLAEGRIAGRAEARQGVPVFIVDDEAELRRSLAQWLRLGGFEPKPFAAAREALAALEAAGTDFPGIVVSDLRMPDIDGMGLLSAVAARDRTLPVVLLTGHGDVAMAVEAMRVGAYDFVEKPFDPDRLMVLLTRAAEARALALENARLRVAASNAGQQPLETRLVGQSPAMRRLRREVAEAAESGAGVFITGETGSGKELIAQSLHALSSRAPGPFVAVNCAAVPETLIEAEFLGHESGAFTGAGRARPGWFEAAAGGTLFLDELTALPARLQPVLLRVLQEREVTRLGARSPRRVDVRVLAATNETVEAALAEGRLRQDLLFRLNTLSITAPPLRARGGDAALLFNHFAAQFADRDGVEAPELAPDDIAALSAHDWPGNVRELMNLAERAVLRSRHGRVSPAALLEGNAPSSEDDGPDSPRGASLRDRLEACERAILSEALFRHGGSAAAVMEELGLPRRTFNEKLVRHGLDRRTFSASPNTGL
ncbi:MAG: sigma-54 dependent transcriptional regulator [Pseudomonadota bacterium]